MPAARDLARQTGNWNNRRFLNPRDMAIIKHDIAALNGKEKRGEVKRHNNRYISICGCGVEGCAVHGSYPSKTSP